MSREEGAFRMGLVVMERERDVHRRMWARPAADHGFDP